MAARVSVPLEHEDMYVSDEDSTCGFLFFVTFLVAGIVGLVSGGIFGWQDCHFWPSFVRVGVWLLGAWVVISALAIFFKKASLFISPVLLGVFFGFLITYPCVYVISSGIKGLIS
jgi:hypothetical protein